MKFSTAAILSLATGAIAMPWSTQPRNSHGEITLVPHLLFPMAMSPLLRQPSPGLVGMTYYSVSELTNLFSLRVKVGESPAKARLAKTDICWLLCASDEIQCPEGWV
jgi:hypothetical protein